MYTTFSASTAFICNHETSVHKITDDLQNIKRLRRSMVKTHSPLRNRASPALDDRGRQEPELLPDTTYLFASPCTSGNEVCGRVRATTRDRPCAPTSGLSEGCPRHPRTGASPALRLHELGGLIRRIVGLTLAVNLAVGRGATPNNHVLYPPRPRATSSAEQSACRFPDKDKRFAPGHRQWAVPG